jgi:PAS domain-containing protein
VRKPINSKTPGEVIQCGRNPNDLLENVARYREAVELMDLMHDAIFVRKLNNEIIFRNWVVEQLLGKSPHQLPETSFQNLKRTTESQTGESALTVMQAGMYGWY